MDKQLVTLLRQGSSVVRSACVVGFTLALALSVTPAHAQDYSGRIVMTGGIAAGGFAAFNIWVDEYATNDERERLITMLAEDGPEKLESELAAKEAGRFQMRGEISNTLGYAHETLKEDGGRIITLVGARPLYVFEQAYLTRSRDFPFGVIQLDLGEDGEGEGSIFAAARIRINRDGQVEVTSYGNGQNFRIISVRAR